MSGLSSSESGRCLRIQRRNGAERTLLIEPTFLVVRVVEVEG